MTEPQHFPEAFRARMVELLGAPEAAELFRALAEPATGLRVNSLRLAPERFREIAPFGLEPLPFPEEGFLVAREGRPGRHPFHDAGLYYLQDPGAMAVGALVDPRPGERVLDLAAAPGGKATHLAARMRGQGLLVANDVNPARARELAGNLERCGVRNALVLAEAADRLAERFAGWFDRVLLDAPCSGESMFHKSEAARADWSSAGVLGCARRQGDLILEAARMVRPGGLLVYSTCTFSPEENEGVVAGFLTVHPDFELAELPAVPGAGAGRADWVDAGGAAPDLGRTLRLWPQRVPGAGHFVAAFRRRGGDPSPEADPQRPALSRDARDLLRDFAADSLVEEIPEERVHEWRSELYLLPPEAPELQGLRVVRPGWWLGTLAKNRVEPSHALALGLDAGGARRVVELAPDSSQAAAYLRGETLSRPGEAGWSLVTVEGFALGWGKRVGSTVKNHFPKGLRWRG